MSEENVESIRQGFEAYNRRGVRAVAENYWHPDVEWEVGPWRGTASGVSVAQPFWWMFRMEGGRQRHIRIFDSRTMALEAAGVPG